MSSVVSKVHKDPKVDAGKTAKIHEAAQEEHKEDFDLGGTPFLVWYNGSLDNYDSEAIKEQVYNVDIKENGTKLSEEY